MYTEDYAFGKAGDFSSVGLVDGGPKLGDALLPQDVVGGDATAFASEKVLPGLGL